MTSSTDHDILDLNTIRSLREMDILADVVQLFLRDGMHRLGELESALAAGAMDVVRSVAHSLKGSALNLGAISLAREIGAVEAAARSEDASELSTLIARARNEFERASATLRAVVSDDRD